MPTMTVRLAYRYGPSGVKGVTVLEGIKAKVGNRVKVNYGQGCEITDAHWPETEVLPEPLTREESSEIGKAVAAAEKSDLTVVVLGDSMKTVGESQSRTVWTCRVTKLDLVQGSACNRQTRNRGP